MKLLITTFTYPPNKDGVAEACRQMAEGLAELGWDVHVVTGALPITAESTPPLEFYQGVNVHRFDLDLHSSRHSTGKKEIDRYMSFVKSENFAIIVNQCWDAWPTKHLQALINQTNAKWIQVSHGYSMHIYTWYPFLTMGLVSWFRGLLWTFKKLPVMIRDYDCLIFLSRRKDFGRFLDHKVADLMKHPQIHVIPNGTDINGFPPDEMDFRSRHSISNGSMFLCVANYCDRKNQKLTVSAFRKANIADSTLVLVGSELNSYAMECVGLNEKLREAYPACDVIFLESLSRDETLSAYVACDAFLLTAKQETQPIVLIEAMAAGKPWISTAVGCVSEMQGGIVCRTSSDLTDAIKILATNPDTRETLGLKGRNAALAEHQVRRNSIELDRIFKGFI